MWCSWNCRQAARKVGAGAEAAVVESVKAASEVYAPVGGEVTEANAALEAEPAKVNEDPEGAGWFFKLKARRQRRIRQADGRSRLRRIRERSLIHALSAAHPR